jgi:uncharacterized protein
MEQETRSFPVQQLEVRVEAGKPPAIVGYAAVFNGRSRDLGGFVEEIAPGAFRETLARNPDTRANVQHGPGLMTIGRTRNGTLQMMEDETGLRVHITPPDTQVGRDALTLVRGGFLDQMSFQFRVPKGGDDWTKKTAEGYPLRRLLAVDLDGGDVSIVTNPAYPQTSAEARDMASLLTKGESQPEEAGAGTDGEAGEEQDTSQVREDLQRRFAEIAEKEHQV